MRCRGRWSVGLVAALFMAGLAAAPAGDDVDAGASEFVALPAPVRLLDTRPGAPTVDGQFAGIGLRAAESTLELTIDGRGGLPADVASVVLNVTAVDTTGWGFVTVHPTGTARPNASNLNYLAGDTIANTVITRVGDGGKISLYTYAAVHLLVDVAGYLPTDGFHALSAPARLLDTRPGTTTSDGAFVGIGLRPAGSTLHLDVAGRAGIPHGAVSVVLNVTAVIPAEWGFLTVHPTGTARPNASNVNYTAGQTIANTVIARVGTHGRISIYTYAATHLIVDIAGHLTTDTFTPLPAPQRLADTRLGTSTADGQYAGVGLRPGVSTLQLPIAGRAGVPKEASAVVLNVAAVDPLGWGYVTAHPTGTVRPNASNVNYVSGPTIANTVVTRLGAGGSVCIYTYRATHLIVDVAGYLAGPPPAAAGPTCPGGFAYGPPTNLGTLPGGSVSWAGDINNDGVIVGSSYVGTFERHAVWWPHPASGPQRLDGLLDLRYDDQQSIAHRINDAGQILVHASPQAFVVDPVAGVSVEILAPFEGIQVADINNRGQVVGTGVVEWPPCDGCEPAPITRGFIWDLATRQTTVLGTLPGAESSTGDAINDLGHVGGHSGTGSLARPFVWDPVTGMRELPMLPGGRYAYVFDMNNAGLAVGLAEYPDPTPGTQTRGVAWDLATSDVRVIGDEPANDITDSGLVDLWDTGILDLSTGHVSTVPYVQFGYGVGINDHAQAVGRSGSHAAIWEPRPT